MGGTLLAKEPAAQSNSQDQNKEGCKCPPSHLKGQPGALKSWVIFLAGHKRPEKWSSSWR